MEGKKYNIVCFLDDDHGRDVEILLPLIWYAENKLDCHVSFSFIWNIHDIYLKKPDLVLLANTIGSLLHFRISKYAHENGIKVFALISEGNFRTDGSFDYFGYNNDKVFYQEYVCHWSLRTKIFFDKVIPQLGDRNVLTGATGFDRYKIYKFATKDQYLKSKGLEGYKKVIGYAGWAFGKAYNAQGREEMKAYFKDLKSGLVWLEEQMFKVEEILRTAIEANPDILFILKRHPNEANPSITREDPNEMIRLRNYSNVLYITGNENLHDLISVCDFWCAFESTTAMEAWLMNKQTLFINPDSDFNRDRTYLGTPIIKTSAEYTETIKAFYETGEIPDFYRKDIQENRKIIIRDTIGFDDGLNHLRAGYYLKKVLMLIDPGKKRKIKLNLLYLFKFFLLHFGKYFYIRKIFLKLPRFKKTVWLYDKWRLKNVSILMKRYNPYLESFYNKMNLNNKIVKEDLFK